MFFEVPSIDLRSQVFSFLSFKISDNLQYLCQLRPERIVLLRLPLWHAFETSTGVADLFGCMALQEQRVNVVRRILHPVLIQHYGVASQAHGGKAIILGDHDITGLHQIDQRKVHAVSALGEGQRLGTVLLENMGGVAQQQALDFVRLCQRNGALHHRAAVRIHQNSHR